MTECPPNSIELEIIAGDTLYKIAKDLNIPLELIIKYNPEIDPKNLKIGQIICIPQIPDCPNASKPYIIKKGDTFYNISKKYGILISHIIAVNPQVNPNNLQIGQIICLPIKK